MRLGQLVGIVLVVLALGCKEVQKNEIPTPEKADTTIAAQEPVAEYEDLTGKPIQLSDYKGKRVLLNYWATWCKPCIEEMPALERLQKELAAENYVFLFPSDQSVKVIEKFRASKDFDLTFVKFNGTWADKEISALPVTLIYNEVGEQVARFDGAMAWDSSEIITELKALH
ncbi:TlpA family protein disulfide reductase [Maribacter sp.]|nr:TlpA family protein disulfide reductase [Maribacter sp.]